MNIDTKALKGIIEEIEASKARQKGEAEFQREAIKRAVKQHQLDGKAIRIVLQRRAMGDEKRDEQDYYVHAYEMALGGKKLAADALANGATIREAAAAGGISTGAAGNLAKVVQKSAKLDKPEDGDDGITGGEDGKAEADNDAARGVGSRKDQGQQQWESRLADGRSVQHEEAGDGADAGGGTKRLQHGVRSPEENADPVRLTAATPFLGDDPGPIPPFLRGSRTAQGRGA